MSSAISKILAVSVVVVIIIAAAAVSGFLLLSKPSSKMNVIFGTPVGPTAENTPLVVGINQSYFSSQGVNVTWDPFSGGADMMQAASSGQIQMGIGSTAIIIQSMASGVPIVMVGPQFQYPDFLLAVNANSTITNISQLKGGSIAAVGPTSVQVLLIYALAKAENWTVGKDIKIAIIPGLSAEIAALKTGAIQALAWTAEVTYTLAEKNQVRILANFGQFIP